MFLSPVTSTTGCWFCFGFISSFFLELFLHSSPVACWASTNLGSSSFSIQSFCLFILFLGFSRQKYWSGLPFPSSVDHILSRTLHHDLSVLVALHGMAHSFIELDKTVVHVIRLVSFLWLWFLSTLWCSLSAYHLTRISLTLYVGYPLVPHSWPQMWGIFPLGLTAPALLADATRCSSAAQPLLKSLIQVVEYINS